MVDNLVTSGNLHSKLDQPIRLLEQPQAAAAYQVEGRRLLHQMVAD
jgi:hypothetical protein